MFEDESLYEVLGVSPDASQDEIKAAYRRLAKQYHPDVNPTTEASSRMSEINHAYDMLCDPAKRSAYDTAVKFSSLSLDEQTGDEEATYASAIAFAQQARCQGCGRFDHTLRIAVFPYVFSLLIMSFKRGEAGIFCESCRSSKSTKWGVISLLFGPWGVPWGIFWTLESLITNLRKGKTPKQENRGFILQLAWVQVILGNISEARATLNDLLGYGHNQDTQNLEDYLVTHHPEVTPIPSKMHDLRLGFIAIVLAILAIYGFVGFQIFGSASNGDSNSSVPIVSPNGSGSVITTNPTAYGTLLENWVATYSQAYKRYMDKTNNYLTYDSAAANSYLFISESDLFIDTLQDLLREINAEDDVPTRHIELHSSFEVLISSDLQVATLLREAVKYGNISKWNQGVTASYKADTARMSFVTKLETFR